MKKQKIRKFAVEGTNTEGADHLRFADRVIKKEKGQSKISIIIAYE